MFSISELKTFIEGLLNLSLAEEEREIRPFKLFTDVGEANNAYREFNTVYYSRYGVVSVLTSNNASLNGLQIYNATASVDVLINVDRPISDISGDFSGDFGEYPQVKEMRSILDNVAVNNSGIAQAFVINDVIYAVTPTFTLSTAGDFAIDTSRLGKVVPMTFTVDISVVETGINSSAITITIDGEDVYASQIAEDMVFSSEGQTRMGDSRSTFDIQEARYSLSFVMPLTTSDFSQSLLAMMHTGVNDTRMTVTVTYGKGENAPSYNHIMKPSSVRLTAQIPNNAGLNVEMVEADVT